MKRSRSFISGRTIFLSALVLIIVVFVVEIIVTNFALMGIRAGFSELPHNLESIRTAELVYYEKYGEFRSVGECPLELPGRQRSSWEGECADRFQALGWAPDSSVRCQYMVQVISRQNEVDDFKLTAQCDLDGDGIPSIFEASRNSPYKRITSVDIY